MASNSSPDTAATTAVLVRPGQPMRLADINPGPAPDDAQKKHKKHLRKLHEQLSDYQEKLYAEHRRSLLLVFQAIDTGGKDGTIRVLLTGVNPAGVEVAAFKRPSEEELSHDFLWRIHQRTPSRGHIGVFNRSHYEDVLVTRVHGLIKAPVWEQRYQDINNFEQLLTPFQEALAATSTADAPWYVIPANDKHQRDLAIAEVVVAALAEMNPQPPAADFDLAAQVVE
ncbi:MAG: polyphosphate kinase 2 family protein [Cytophagaceae bacterium]|nr:MAG: polyphosphate kinase 2 family protein [Cytophagaceae bacterium]